LRPYIWRYRSFIIINSTMHAASTRFLRQEGYAIKTVYFICM